MLNWKQLRQLTALSCLALLTACGGGGGSDKQKTQSIATTAVSSSSSSQNQNTPNSLPVVSSSSAASDQVSISGTLTYDRVPFEGHSYLGLDYDSTYTMPIRGILVQAVDRNSQVVAQAISDEQGAYSLVVEQDTDIKIQIPAELLNQQSSQWRVRVLDNTSGNAQYRLEGSLINSGFGTSQERDLHASSGWDGASYSGPRSAGPFAILDSIYDAFMLVDNAQPGGVYPELSVYWSPDNIAIPGDVSRGNIGTSYYTGYGPSIYILGAENNDSDEYDRAVIQHEFGHYLEDQVGRTESLGGSHTQQSRLDFRVAFGEAWGNAFAGMASGDSVYRDSYSADQYLAFSFDVERRGFGNQGWYSEASVQAILYDLFDSNSDANDEVALGFAPILSVLTSDEYLNFNGYASIFPFIDTLKNQLPDSVDAIDTIVKSFNIQGEGGYAEGETNDGGSDIILPLYRTMEVDDTINLCSDADYQDYNGMDVRRFVRISLPNSRNYTFSATKTGGLARSNPQIRVTQQGRDVTSFYSGTRDNETGERFLNAGNYIVEIYEEANVDGNESNSGLVCFDFTIR